MIKLKIVIFLSLLYLISCENKVLPLRINSPDREIELQFSLDDKDSPYYSVFYKKLKIIGKSKLAIEFSEGWITSKLHVTNVERRSRDETYSLVVGKSNTARNHYNELLISLQEKAIPNRKIDIFFRLFNDGVAFRYRIPQQSNLNEFEIIAEHSEFNFFENHHCWALQLENFTTNYENTFNPLTLQDLKPDQIIGLPLTIVSQSGTFMAITEANLTDYAGMYLEGSSILDFGLISRLSPLPSGDRVCVRGTTPHFTPWRVIMIADDPGNLIESNIILNLNEPCAISDISWIKPGKVAWPWWSGRVVSNVDFDGGMNTATMKHYIDFATVYGLEYLLIDATWYGPYKDPSQDITTTIPEVDLPNIISYANANNVDIILWLHWQNTRDQMDKAFPLYEKWGVKGVKVDYMNRDDQEMVNFYHEVVKKAAEHHLLVDFHGSYKPSGIRRTYPNLMTREGILGLEHTKWSNRVTPDHNVTIPYTRMLAGPMDYTPGAFQNVTEKEFKSQYIAPMAMGTRCHHLAMFVVYESPLQMCCDYPGSYRDEAGADFLKVVPASWDETRAINGDIGEFIVIVRRHDDDWFVGAMTNWESRTVGFPLDFLSEGQYELTNYSDGRDAEENPRSISVTSMRINSGDSLSVIMASGGGYVAHLTPVIN